MSTLVLVVKEGRFTPAETGALAILLKGLDILAVVVVDGVRPTDDVTGGLFTIDVDVDGGRYPEELDGNSDQELFEEVD